MTYVWFAAGYSPRRTSSACVRTAAAIAATDRACTGSAAVLFSYGNQNHIVILATGTWTRMTVKRPTGSDLRTSYGRCRSPAFPYVEEGPESTVPVKRPA